MDRHRRGASRGRLVPRLATLAAGLALVAVACGSSTPSPTSTASGTAPVGTPRASPTSSPPLDPKQVYGAIEDQIVALRGIQPTASIEPQVLDEAGIKKLTSDSFKKDNPPERLAANERILKAFGLIPIDASLTDLYVELLGSQVAGLYNQETKKLYVVSRSGGLGPTEKSAFAHEFTHALQDQRFDLARLRLDEIGRGDRSFARLSLVEGDATLAMSYWQIQHLSPAELGQLIAGAGGDASMKVLLAMPAILRESLLFPYIQGLTFVQGLQGAGGWQAVNEAFARPPASTEQILHPEKYAAGEGPIAVDLPEDLASRLGNGWTVALEDTFGEFQLGIWLRGNSAIGGAAAGAAATGWGGDRIAVVEGPAETWGVILRTAWDSAADAVDFESAMTALVDALPSAAAIVPGAGGTERWIIVGSDEPTLDLLGTTLGLAG